MDPRVAAWYDRHPGPRGKARLSDPGVQYLLGRLEPDRVVDLGGEDSLNLWLTPPGWVLRVHKPFVDRSRLGSIQWFRRRLIRRRLRLPRPVRWNGTSVFGCDRRWAELETYFPLASHRPTGLDGMAWHLAALGALYRGLADLPPRIRPPLNTPSVAATTLGRMAKQAGSDEDLVGLVRQRPPPHRGRMASHGAVHRGGLPALRRVRLGLHPLAGAGQLALRPPGGAPC